MPTRTLQKKVQTTSLRNTTVDVPAACLVLGGGAAGAYVGSKLGGAPGAAVGAGVGAMVGAIGAGMVKNLSVRINRRGEVTIDFEFRFAR